MRCAAGARAEGRNLRAQLQMIIVQAMTVFSLLKAHFIPVTVLSNRSVVRSLQWGEGRFYRGAGTLLG